LSLNWLTKLGPLKNIAFTSFPSPLLENIWVEFAFSYALLPCHERAKRDIIG
jgi:hypothetical protein